MEKEGEEGKRRWKRKGEEEKGKRRWKKKTRRRRRRVRWFVPTRSRCEADCPERFSLNGHPKTRRALNGRRRMPAVCPDRKQPPRRPLPQDRHRSESPPREGPGRRRGDSCIVDLFESLS